MKKLLYVLPIAFSIACGYGIYNVEAKDAPMPPKHEWSNPDKDGMKKCKQCPGKWLEKQNQEIDEDYNEAIEKIGKSSFSNDQKDVLANQAKANKELALKQANERKELLMKQMEARKEMKATMKAEKANRKAVKEVNKILMDD